MSRPDYTNIGNAHYIDEMYERFRSDPDSVTDDWRVFFQGFELGIARSIDDPGQDSQPSAMSV